MRVKDLRCECVKYLRTGKEFSMTRPELGRGKERKTSKWQGWGRGK
jgi:hypothetical protein